MQEEIGTLTPTSLILVLCLGFLLLTVPRRYALVPVMIGGCYMTLSQALIIGGLHFYLIRILILFGVLRVLLRGELFSIKLTSIDILLIAWVGVTAFLYICFDGDNVNLSERLGGAYNALGIYFLIRAVVHDSDDVVHAVKMFGLVLIPLAVPFVIEYMTGRNPFFVLGGVPEFTIIRDGKLRCQGSFRHPILAGTFGATALPLFVGLWFYSSRYRLFASGGILTATIIVIASSSSGPLLAYIASVLALMCWMVRSHMRAVRWGIVIVLLAFHVSMKVPVWFLISKLSDLVGGGGWYRSALIDAFLRNFDEWWLIGTGYTAHWMPTGLSIDPTRADIVNQFVAQGVDGGLLGLGLFIWLIVKCFKTTGMAVGTAAGYSFSEQFMIWSLGCALLGHIVSFFSVSYFDQIIIFWYLIIAMIAALVPDGKEDRRSSSVLQNRSKCEETSSVDCSPNVSQTRPEEFLRVT